MNIWVMRHGEAGFNAQIDNQRSLTEKGQMQAFSQGEWLAKRLTDQNVSLDKILVSPYLRTQQTLEQLLSGIQAVDSVQSFANLSNLVETYEGITPNGNPETVLMYLRKLREDGIKNVLIISHLPLVYDFTYALTLFEQSVHFYPAVIAEIDWQTDLGKIVTTKVPS